MQRAPERRRGAGLLLLLALVALAAAPSLVRAVTDAADGNAPSCFSPLPACSARSEPWTTASPSPPLVLAGSIVRWFWGFCVRGWVVVVPVLSVVLYCTAKRSEASSHPSSGIGLILCGAGGVLCSCVCAAGGAAVRVALALCFLACLPTVVKDMCGAVR